MGFLPQSKGEWLRQSKHAVFILGLFGYILFLMEGMTTGLGVYRNPTACWIAAGFALLAFGVASKSQRWIAGAALIVAILGSFYGYHKNTEWKEKLDRLESQESACASFQFRTVV